MKAIGKTIRAIFFAPLLTSAAVICAMGQDATQVDPKHYKVEMENDYVRVLRINYGPKEKSVMHAHPAGVAIFTTGGHSRFSFADGKTEERRTKAGEVIWAPAGSHLPENIGAKPFEVILVELKDGSAAGAMPTADEDSVKADPKHHKVEFENERVRVLRSIIKPKEKTLMHAHPANVVVFLTDSRAKSTLADGKTEEVQGKAGQVTWRDYLKHGAENLNNKPLEVVVVELKGR